MARTVAACVGAFTWMVCGVAAQDFADRLAAAQVQIDDKQWKEALEILLPLQQKIELAEDGEALDMDELRGRVVLIDFWTYTCINCIRTFPHLKAWDAAYRDDGLTIVGVHTPEFPFERDAGNVSDAVDRNGIEYPVAQDNDYGTWTAYGNQYWPAKYLIDADGRVLMPGVIDPHCHLGVNYPYDEDMRTETAQAARGGITTIVLYIRTKEPSYIPFYRERSAVGEENVHIDFGFRACDEGRRSVVHVRERAAGRCFSQSRFKDHGQYH